MSASAARDQHPNVAIAPLTEETPSESVFVRIEDQHLLKLPQTGAVVFGIRIVRVPWTEIAKDRELAGVICQKLRSMGLEIARYKGVAANSAARQS